MSINTKRIEEAATTALKSVLLRCPLLESYISENDRTASWDGSVFAYENERHEKSDFVGKAPIQIKGTGKQIVSDVASFSCSLNDLKNYCNIGGSIFFLISVIPSTGDARIFYSCLHVYDLAENLERAKKQKSFTIKLKLFPADNPNEMTAIFLDFIENSRKQTGFVGKKIPTLEEIEQRGVKVEAITLSAPGIGFDPIKIGNYLSTHDFYLYAKLKGLDVEIPIDKVSNATLLRTIPGKILIKDTEYYPSYLVVHENGTPSLKIGQGLKMKLDFEHNSSNFSYRPAGTLDDYIKDTEFFSMMMESREVTINGVNLHFKAHSTQDLEKYRTALLYYKDIKIMLNYLGITESLQFDNLTEQDGNNIRNFVNTVLYNKNIGFPGVEAESTIYGAFKISNLSIWLWANKQDDGYYQIENFFAPHSVVYFAEDDAEQKNPISVSHYLLLNKEAFIHTSNMDIEAVKNDIAIMNPNPALVDKVTFMLLDVLNGYDEQEEKDTRLLDLAETINSWLSNDDNQADPQVLKINQLQIVKRRRQFVFSERAELMDLAKSESPHIRCGAFLLLDENEEAQNCFKKLSQEEQEQFLQYPIAHFGKLVVASV